MPLDALQLAELIARHAAPLRVWVGGRCTAADDVVQEAFCRLAIQDPSPDQPVAWLYRVCRNLAEKDRLAALRRRRREERLARPEAAAGQVDALELAEMLAAVERLDSPLREVLVARVWGGLSLDEIGRLCGISAATACRRYQAALETLRTQLAAPCENSP